MPSPETPTTAPYVPALGRFDSLGRWHDTIAAVAIRRTTLHADLVSRVQNEAFALTQPNGPVHERDRCDPSPRVCVLDVGCGNGQLLTAIEQTCRASGVASDCIGIDRDPHQALRAGHRPAAARPRSPIGSNGRPKPHTTAEPHSPRLLRACATALPLATASVDIATSCISMHHLDRDERRDCLAEIYRVLRPGGTFALTDCWKAENLAMRAFSYLVAITDGFERTRENRLHGLQPALADAGFSDIQVTKRYSTLCGTVAQCVCRRGETESPPRLIRET